MLRIQCESCQAPYQVDERRVPPQGLKMRCPKCGHTFLVEKPADSAAPAPAAAVAKPKTMKQTMVGLGEDVGLPAAKAGLPKAPPLPQRPIAPIAPPIAPPIAKPPQPVAAPPDLGADLDLPAARPVAPKVPPRPAPPRPIGAAPPAPAPKPQAPPAADELDLPAMPNRSELPAALGLDLPARVAKPPAFAPPVASPAVASPATTTAAAFGEIDLPALAADLPSVGASLPVARPAPARPQPKAAPVTFDLDLPSGKAPPPKIAKDDLELDLGPPAADLPAPLPELPSLSAALPTVKKTEPAFGEIDLPMLDASLPTVASALPTVANVMPAVGQQLPSVIGDERMLSTHNNDADFGEIDLGGDAPPLVHVPSAPPKIDSAFAELDLGATDLNSLPPDAMSIPPTPPPVPAHPPPVPKKDGNALTFGEVDLGGEGEAPLQTESASNAADELSLPQQPAPKAHEGAIDTAAEVSLPITTVKKVEREVDEKPSRAPMVLLLLFALLAIGGGSLQLTKHGAFGYLTIGDSLRAKDYAAFAETQAATARTRTSKDVFPETRGAVDDLTAAHWRMPRARALSAYAAFAAFSYETRFGADVERNAKAKLLLQGLNAEQENKYLNVALAAEDAAAGNWEKARKGLDAASKRDVGDPIQKDIALLRGEVELSAKDPKAAKTAFDTAIKLAPSAQAHFGLARVARLTSDWDAVGTECDTTIQLSPNHPGALLLRAVQRYVAKNKDADALADLALITDGAAKAFASNQEVAQAQAGRGNIYLASGRAGDARNAFEAALKLDARNVDALVGQGMVFFQESRFTEALTRFDTALGARKDDELAIGYDALAKIKLERLKEAKDQLLAARAQFPKSMRLAYALAEAESALGNSEAAEKALHQAIDLASPKDPEASMAYIALAKLLASRNRDKEAAAVIEDAKSKLPDSAPFNVALGEYMAAQGQYDEAVARFRHALDISPSSLSTHFRLGTTYRHMRKTDLAAQEFDHVLSIDKDYPGLALERGLLFEESGEVDRALEQFKNALARAPDDPDLQLRVGASYVAVNRPADALPMLKKVLEKRPTSAEANHYIGRALLLDPNGSKQEAMRYLQSAAKLDPNQPEYHLYVGWAANESPQPQLGLAEEEIEKALKLDKLLADAYWQRGVLERKKLQVEDALRDLKHALELRPSRIEAHATMAECYEDKNDPGMGLSEWRIAVAGNNRIPFWRYRLGKLLLERNAAAEAAPHLTYAVDEALKLDIRPPWLSRAEFGAADALRRTGKRADAVAMYRRYLDIAATNDPDRRDALNALASMGETYRPGR